MALNQIPFSQQPTQIYVKLSKQQTGVPIIESFPSWVNLRIELRVKQKYLWIVQQENGLGVVLKEMVGRLTGKIFWVDSRVFLHPIASISFVTEMLAHVHIDGHRQGDVLQQISSFGIQMANSASNSGEGKRMMYMSVDLSVVKVLLFDERAALARVMQVSMDEGRGSGVLPASKSSIDGLQSVRFHDGDSIKDCTICLDELTVGSLVTRMPCSHIFHGECITRWLETSHLCPLCRFEMPI